MFGHVVFPSGFACCEAGRIFFQTAVMILNYGTNVLFLQPKLLICISIAQILPELDPKSQRICNKKRLNGCRA